MWIKIVLSDIIVTLCESPITFCAFSKTLSCFVIYLCWFNITLLNLFITLSAFPNTFVDVSFRYVMMTG